MAQINKPTNYFDTILYTGDGAASRTITGLNFSTDLIWYKRRSVTGSHRLIDTVRGINKNLATDLTNAENTESTYVTAINSDGWDIGSNTDVNTNGNTMVVWNWRASDSSAVSNTDGSITSSVSANTTSGFSIVSYTGTGGIPVTVGHGLGTTPDCLIIKNRSNAYDWAVYHKDLGNTGGLFLNSTAAFTTDADLFNNTSPTSSVVTFSNSVKTNQGSANHIMYAFNSVKGFSKFGKYTGNGSADGPFVYCGFKPALVIYKGASGTGTVDNWEIHTNKTDTSNPMDTVLYPNGANAESLPSTTTDRLDFLSNGFKIRTGSGDYNASGSTYVYMAFAENPLVGTNNIPATAR